MKVVYTPAFKKSFKKLDKPLQKTAWKKLEIFKKDQFDPKLRTHKLKGGNFFSFSVNYRVRIIFKIIDNRVVLIDIGDHSLYKNL